MKTILLFALTVVPTLSASAGTLAELVAKEEGVDFGDCVLTPKPKLTGDRIVAVLPARFPEPASWQTFDLLLVGVAGDQVTETKELKLKHGINPREANVTCKGNQITVVELSRGAKPKPRVYRWDGSTLAPGK